MMKAMKKQGGFTLIELMVVIVIIGILVAIALPNFIGAQDRAKVSSVKANMHTVQTMIETYAVDWGGTYPSTMAMLESEAKQSGREYWKNFVNPFTSKTGSAESFTVAAGLSSGATEAGEVQYDPVSATPITRYYVYGKDKAGNPIQDKGQPFTLTNS